MSESTGRPGLEASSSESRPVVVCRVAEFLAAIPLDHVSETMRPLPIRSFEGMADPLVGLAIVRGRPIPVVSARRLLGLEVGTTPTRFVALRLGSHAAALAVDGVVGVRILSPEVVGAWPSLAESVAPGRATAVALLDHQLLLVLQAARLVSEQVWAAVAAAMQGAS